MTDQLKNILVLRFSAMGDVALLAPVLRSFLHRYPNYQLTLATRPKFSAFFFGLITLQKTRTSLRGDEAIRITDEALKAPLTQFNFFSADVDGPYSGLPGIFKLFFDLRKSKPDLVLDLHDNIRTRIICFLFRMIGTRIIRFDKGRGEKKAITRKQNKIRKSLAHTVERYQQAFSKAGFSFPILSGPHLEISNQAGEIVKDWLDSKQLIKNENWIGLAPFAAHKSKIWPLENYADLILAQQAKAPTRFFLFGGGKTEIQFFESLQKQFPDSCVVVAGQLKLEEEIALMHGMDKMICVDSSNMHIAALLGIPMISIWGGTHSDTGFGPYGNTDEKKVQIALDELPCRPCSVYGTAHCHRGDFACLTKIKVTDVGGLI